MMMTEPERIDRYFVDEAGDLTFFDRLGGSIVGSEGVSRCFVVAAALIHDLPALTSAMESLRARLLRDPYFAGVPSMSPHGGKTALLFHAKDDAAEVRKEVFDLLKDARVEVYAGFRRKSAVVHDLRAYFKRTQNKLGSDFIYEELVSSIFKDRLHLASETHIVFARRGKANRNIALSKAINLAKTRFEAKWKKGIDRPAVISSSTPSETVGLQVTDYYLWALQRFLERGEDRFFNLLGPAYRLILDRDDTRERPYGEYYSASSNPLSKEKMMPVI